MTISRDPRRLCMNICTVAYSTRLIGLGPHGLPLIGRADWNDCLNLNAFSEISGESFQTTTHKDGKVAESVFIAGLFILAAKELGSLIGSLPQGEERNRLAPLQSGYAAAAAQMESAVWKHGWDGQWFLRAYDDFWASSRIARQPGGPDLHRATRHLRHGRPGSFGRPRPAGPGRRG